MTDADSFASPLGGDGPLIDPHAHFHTPASGRADWARYNASRLAAGDQMGVGAHVASILGSWGHTSPTYFPSPDDVTRANAFMRDLARDDARVHAYVAVNPNHPAHALAEIATGVAHGAVGVKLAASRRADDALLDDIAALAAEEQLPILHHIWQDRRRDWPNQDASDGVELARLAARHPRTRFLLAHIGGGGDWAHTMHAVRDVENIVVDLSGSGIDRGMIDAAVSALGASRVLWAADLTLCTGLTKLWALDAMTLTADERADIRWRNAVRLFPRARFVHRGEVLSA
jgi:predicted TIM-barrel fold metal-dependent hydrolase